MVSRVVEVEETAEVDQVASSRCWYVAHRAAHLCFARERLVGRRSNSSSSSSSCSSSDSSDGCCDGDVVLAVADDDIQVVGSCCAKRDARDEKPDGDDDDGGGGGSKWCSSQFGRLGRNEARSKANRIDLGAHSLVRVTAYKLKEDAFAGKDTKKKKRKKKQENPGRTRQNREI